MGSRKERSHTGLAWKATQIPPRSVRSLMADIRHIVRTVLLLDSEISTLVRESRSMLELEQAIQVLTQQVAGTLLEAALEEIDRGLMAEREESLRLVGTRTRKMLTTFGPLKIKRRLYRDTKTGKTVFLLDEAFGLPAYARISDNLAQICQEIGLDVPFRQAARIIGLVAPRVSAMSVWKAFQRAGAEAAKETQAKREAVIKLQRAEARHGEVQVVVAYEDKENTGSPKKPRRILKEKHLVAGLTGSREIWEEASASFGEVWDLSAIPKVHIGGDGAEWIREGQEHFPNATYHLDPFHLKKRVSEALGKDFDTRQALAAALEENSKDKAEEVLNRAAKTHQGTARKRIQALTRYILSNWEGIQANLEGTTLGTIEGQNWRIVARRMKRRGARWGLKGGDYMPRLLALREEGTLGTFLKRLQRTRPMDTEKIAKLNIQRITVRKRAAQKRGTEEEWLKATVPALCGPSVGEPWVRYVLRLLPEAGYVA